MEQLEALKSELAIVRSEKGSGSVTTTAAYDSVDFRSSEVFESNQPVLSENASILATMNNMSLGSLHIPECSPSEGESDIDKKAYEHWKEVLVASFNLVRAQDERAKMDIFRIKAGPKLLEIMQGTSSVPEMPNECTHPFSNAIARLDQYFGSRTYIIGQRGKLMNMVQRDGESNLAFVRRVAAAAKLCGYKCDEEMEAVVRTIVKGTADSRVRVLAHRNWVNQGDLNSLIEMVRDREMELFNEQEYQKHNRQNNSVIATVTQSTYTRPASRRGPGRGAGPRYRGNQRGRGTYRRERASIEGSSRGSCWRCASIYHEASNCPNLDKVCHNCKRRGHLARTCATQPQVGAGQKRQLNEPADEESKPKIAAITQNGEEDEKKVHDSDVE